MNGKLKKVGAGGILTTITFGALWQLYSALDMRIRANEISLAEKKPIIERMADDIKEIKKDVKSLIRRGK